MDKLSKETDFTSKEKFFEENPNWCSIDCSECNRNFCPNDIEEEFDDED